MSPLESPSASGSHSCVSGRCCTGRLHNARSNWLGRVSSVRLPFAVEEAAANSHFLFGNVFSPQGLQHRLIRMEGRRPIAKVYYSQQSCANLLVSALRLSKVRNENIKGKVEERGVARLLPLNLASTSAAAQRVKQQMLALVLRCFCKSDAFLSHTKSGNTRAPYFSTYLLAL